jgi:hypothetical protein
MGPRYHPQFNYAQDATLSIRLRRDQLNTIKKAAKNAGISLADAVRMTMLAWAKRKQR